MLEIALYYSFLMVLTATSSEALVAKGDSVESMLRALFVSYFVGHLISHE
jgi:hypothetical protein